MLADLGEVNETALEDCGGHCGDRKRGTVGVVEIKEARSWTGRRYV